MIAASQYFALTKPRILPLVLFSGLAALGISSHAGVAFPVAAGILIGVWFTAGCANSLNSYLEYDIDALMERTKTRPLPAGKIEPARALAFGLALGILGIATLYYFAGTLPAAISLAAILVYVCIYTLWLKPRTPFAVIVGGFSGAAAPLIIDAAVHGQITAVGWLLFGLVFIWQPPHFYAIALFRRDDYARASIPMLPDVIGERATYWRIILWSLALIPCSVLFVPYSKLGNIYLVSALLLGAYFIYCGVRLLRRGGGAVEARRLFFASLVYLVGIFTAMFVDSAWSWLS
jgi:protoheme IX farnesyltransferase